MSQVNQIQFFATGLSEDHTPSSAVTAGVPLDIGGRAAVSANDIAADALGAIQVRGLFRVVQNAEIIALDADVWWDTDGDPVDGTAGTGAATATPQAAADGFLLGVARLASVAADAIVIIDLNGKTKDATITDPTDLAEALTAIIAVIDALENNGIIDRP